MALEIVDGRTFMHALVDAGVITNATTRVVIDVELLGPVIVYVEQYGTKSLLELAPLLKGAKIHILKEDPK